MFISTTHTLIKRKIKKTMTAPIKGYSAISIKSVDLVNINKQLEEQLLQRIELLESDEDLAVDKRCLAIAKTELQTAFMWLNRAIFKPQRITLD
jgi:hypothetical protein